MARFADREKARSLRAEGKSYSEIQQELGIGKGTLSEWLKDMPLSPEQIRQLRDLSPRRIERFRETMRKKREVSLDIAYERAKKDIGELSSRDLFIAGLYLYWGEGMKVQRSTVGFANTDPAVIKAFLSWMMLMHISADRIYVRLHLYADMDVEKEKQYWSTVLQISTTSFRNPYIKKSTLSGLTYKNGHGHGTCNLIFENVAMKEYITMALKYLREQHIRP